jgi:hypothetical protein
LTPVLADGVEEAAPGVEAVGLAPEGRRQIEAEAVDVHLLDPVAQAVGDHLQHAGMRHGDGVSAAGVVDVVARLVGQQAVIGGVVDAAEGQGRPEVVAFRGVVVDDVQDDLDAGAVQAPDHGLELADRAGHEVARLGCEEGRVL